MSNVNNKLFIQIETNDGSKYVNITSIALIELKNSKTKVTLKEKDSSGNNISFESHLQYGHLTAEIHQLVAKS
jgi:hypothetical protein